MGFFNKTHKKLAEYNSYSQLQQAYEQTEFDLETPEFKKKNKK